MPKKKNSLEEISVRNQQQGARQVRSSTNSFVSYVRKRPLALDRKTTIATESGTTATTKHTAYISPKSRLGEKKHQKNDAIPGRMHAAHGFLPYILSTYYYDLRVTQLNNRRNDYFPLFFVSKMYSLFFGTPSPHAIKYVTDKKHVVCNRASLRVVLLVRTYITCTRVQTMSICPNLYNTTLEAQGTRPLAMLLCGFFWGRNRNHYYLLLVLVTRPLATSISMYVRLPTESQ